MSPGRSMKCSPVRVWKSSVPLNVMTNWRVGASCHSKAPPALVSRNEMLTTLTVPLRMSPRSPLGRSIMPSSKCELSSSPVHSRIQRIIETSLHSVMACCCFDLASEDAVADDGVEQHQRENEETLAPKHEGETGMWRRRFLDRDRERDHVRPERDRQCAERRRENQRYHIVRHSIPAVPNTRGRHERRDDPNRRKDK